MYEFSLADDPNLVVDNTQYKCYPTWLAKNKKNFSGEKQLDDVVIEYEILTTLDEGK